MKKTVFIILVLLFAVSAYAMQFEDLKWGMSEDSVLSLLKNKGITIEGAEDYSFMGEKDVKYKKSSLYGHPCTVTVTVSEDLGLYKVWVEWTEMADARSFQKKLKDDFISKYGNPKESESGQVTEKVINYDAWNEGDIWKEDIYSITVIGEYADSEVSKGQVHLVYTDDKADEEMNDRLIDDTGWY